MEKPKNLHPIVTVLLMAVIIFVSNYLVSTSIIYLVVKDGGYQMYMAVYPVLQLLYWLIYPVTAALLCVKVFEKREIRIWVLLLIVLCVSFVCMIHNQILVSIAAAYGDVAVAQISQVLSWAVPMILAALIYLYVYIFDKPAVEANAHDRNMHISLAEHILLMIFTGGIWFLVWVFRTTAYLNCRKGEDHRNPGSKVLLCMFVPFYSIYWTYKSARRIDALSNDCGIPSDITMACLILEFFVPIIPPILMQERINKIINSGESTPTARVERDPWDF